MMSLGEISSVLTGICARFDADISVEGGEPFLRVGIDHMLADLDVRVLGSLTVTTNGTIRIRSEEKVLRNLGMLRISIDGHVDELQHELRGVDLAPVLHTCRQLQEQDVPFTVRMTLWKRNVRLLREIYEWAEANAIERLSLFEYQSSGRGIGQNLLYSVSAEDADVFLDNLAGLPRPSCLRHLTVNLAERRLNTVLRRRDHLQRGGVAIHELPEMPNCTINFDGTVGISPWRVTAHGAPDVFTTTSADDFLDTVEAAADNGALRDDSGCVSRVQLRVGQAA
jgi:MoaA/NifB/PqqE/SkfB family radical SAM enzyme